MEKYDYYEEVTNSVIDYINDHEIKVTEENRDEVEERLNDECFISDSVTGNASGSYFCNAWKAEEALCHNMDLLGEAVDEFCCSADILRSPEAADVTIRCYVLGSAVAAALDTILD